MFKKIKKNRGYGMLIFGLLAAAVIITVITLIFLFKNKKSRCLTKKDGYRQLCGDFYVHPFSSFPPTDPLRLMFRMSSYTLHDLPQAFRDIFYSTQLLNPGHVQVYLDDDDCRSFLTETYPEYVPHWEALVPGAYKSDLVRLCLLHKFGGTYNDSSHQYMQPLRSILEPSAELVLVNERMDGPGILNSFIFARKPQHPILTAMLQHVTQNIHDQSYGENSLDITGPVALGKCIEQLAGYTFTGAKHYGGGMHIVQGHRVQLLQHLYEGEYVTLGDERIIKTKFEQYSDLMYHSRGILGYAELWSLRKVYTSV